MIGSRSLSITSRKDLEVGTLETSFVNFLSRRANIYGEESRQFVASFKQALIDLDEFHVPKELEPEQVRRSEYMNLFFATLDTCSKRDLVRILNCYSWINRLDSLMSAKTSRAESIANQVDTLIGKILAQNQNKSPTNRSVLNLDFTQKDDLESGNGYHSLSAGVLTNQMEVVSQPNFTAKITAAHDMYESNVYVDGKTDSTVRDLQIGKPYFNVTPELDEVAFEVRNAEAFSVFRVKLTKPFTILSVGADDPDTGSPIDITERVIGLGIDVDDRQIDLRSPLSSVNINGESQYEVVLPSPVTVVRFTIRLTRKDSYQFARTVKQNNHGDVIKKYSIKDSLLLRRSITIAVPESYMRNLMSDAAEGETVTQVEAAPYSTFTINAIEIESISAAQTSTNKLKRFVSASQVKYVEIFVDAYDPQRVISYEVEADFGQKDTIDPVNSNGTVFRVTYPDKLPNYFNINVTIPTSAPYNPIINGIVIRAGEKEI